MIEVTEHHGIATVRMRHGKANVLDVELCQALTDTLQSPVADSADALVLTGTRNIFSAGVDLVRLLRENDDYRLALVESLSRAFRSVFFCPKPVVAAVNGHAIAGGCILACAADFRVMRNAGARIGVPELLVGVPLPAAAVEIMRFVTPCQRLGPMVFEGSTHSPAQALEQGLVNELAEDDAVMDRAVKQATQLAAIPASSFELTKSLLRQPSLHALQRESTRQIDEQVGRAWNSSAVIDAVRRYVDKTLKK